MGLVLRELSGRIIGAAIEVHQQLGPGFLESVYEQALTIELRERGISFHSQMEIPVHYRAVQVGVHRLDLLVEDRIVVELKVLAKVLPIHFLVVRSYLSAARLSHGLILNFSGLTLGIHRVLAR